MRIFLLLLGLSVLAAAAFADATPGADATLILYRADDPESLALARFYASQRGIMSDRIVPLPCSAAEEISRAEYDLTIAGPLKQILTDHGWWKVQGNPPRVIANAIRFVALMKGVPLKILPTPNYPGDVPGPPPLMNQNGAAVDSELSALGWLAPQISGPLTNPYYRSFKPFAESNLPMMMLVCRIDAPTFAIARRMITDGLAAEANGLWGFGYVDSRGITDPGLAEGDKWLTEIVDDGMKHGIPVIADTGPAMFPEHDPLTHAAFYYGWYSEQPAGAFATGSVQFVPGAVAIHLHSFSGATVRDATHFWVGPLLAQGAAATIGNVYEPYLPLTPTLDVVENRLREGFSFAESAYSSMRGLSWMTTFVGDPLYRPYRKLAELSLDPTPPSGNEFAAYRQGAQLWFERDRATGEKALQQSGTRLKSGVIFEGLAGLQARERDLPATLRSFETALKFYRDREDLVRVAYREASLLHGLRRDQDALQLSRRMITLFPRGSEVLQKLVDEIAPPPSPAKSP